MRSFIAISVVLFSLVMSGLPAQAAPTSASTVTQSFGAVNLSPSVYSELFSAAAVVKAVKGFTVASSAGGGILLAIGGAGSEAVQLKIQPGYATPNPVYYPMVISQNQRISIKSSTGTLSTGEIVVNLFYN